MTPTFRIGLSIAVCCGLTAAFYGCGSDASAPPGSGVGGSSGTGAGGGTAGDASSSGGTGAVITDAGPPDGIDPDAACAAITESAKNSPLHLYIMLDKSNSMAGGQWTAAVAGLTAFVQSADSAGVSVGLKFFPRAAGGPPACDQKAYATPDVAFAVLPGNAAALVTALGGESPNGLSTPTYPALGGGLLKGIELVQNNPGHTAAVLLVTDGAPAGPGTICAGVNPEDWNEIAKLATTGVNFSPSVLTYVVGLPGVDQTFANQIAAAGGTQSAILVSNTNVQAEFEQALAKVRGEALPCEYELPDKVSKGEIEYGRVNLTIDSGGKKTDILQTTDCNKGAGWYYDPPAPATPKRILLCPSICDSVKKDFTAKLDILLGCKTQVVR